ncbi:Chromo shadow domain,Chromo/chromo shadow domain,Chromo domain-like [Cinara cedri]|uniref:Chromo shadow domain,Chromo/chromo shadow domain,Chromo domain-like n=1 Tax=Cinara cedri TaxID=506608 RepID=A0A5E4N3D0_9HEMI|nr:Chromo shadow domain,Chromo/chromo shadow domain,Chromo domain-like [Cinara cedri]
MQTRIINDEDFINYSEGTVNDEFLDLQDTDSEEEQLEHEDFSATNNTRDTDMVAERIIESSTNESGQRMFLVKWRDIDEPELITASEAHLRCTQAVIQFYQDRLVLRNNELFYE